MGEAHPPSDSICTEDFARRFRDEMVELTLPESDTERLDKEEEAEITDCDTCQPGRNEQRVVNADGKGPRERHETPQRTGDFGSSEYSFYSQTCSFRIKTNVKYTCLSACCCLL